MAWARACHARSVAGDMVDLVWARLGYRIPDHSHNLGYLSIQEAYTNCVRFLTIINQVDICSYWATQPPKMCSLIAGGGWGHFPVMGRVTLYMNRVFM